MHTRWIETEFANDIPPYAAPAGAPEAADPDGCRERITVEVGGRRLEVTLPASLRAASPARGPSPAAAPRREGVRAGRRGSAAGAAAPSGDALVSPMQGTIVKLVAADGEQVAAGDTIVVLEAMKMEQPLTAHKAGTVSGLTVEVGQTVAAGAVICELSG